MQSAEAERQLKDSASSHMRMLCFESHAHRRIGHRSTVIRSDYMRVEVMLVSSRYTNGHSYARCWLDLRRVGCLGGLYRMSPRMSVQCSRVRVQFMVLVARLTTISIFSGIMIVRSSNS